MTRGMTAPELMLATNTTLPVDVAARTLTSTGRWSAELKLDGIRAAVILGDDTVRIFSRNRLDITYQYPDLVAKLSPLGISAVLDGEIVVMGADGQPHFSLAQQRNAQGSARKAAQLAATKPATFVAFDVLFLGVDTQGLSYEKRRRRLEAIEGLNVNPRWDDGQAMWEFVREHNLEGLVLKRKDSTYRPGRSSAWAKVKATHRISALVSGFEAGEGNRAPTFGALQLALLDETGALVSIGHVGTGFANADCVALRARLDAEDHPIIVDVEYLQVSPSGQLRNPSFKGVRTDLDPLDCTLDQFNHPMGAG